MRVVKKSEQSGAMRFKFLILLFGNLVWSKQICQNIGKGFDQVTRNLKDKHFEIIVNCNECEILRPAVSSQAAAAITFRNCSAIDSIFCLEILSAIDANYRLQSEFQQVYDEKHMKSLVEDFQFKFQITNLTVSDYNEASKVPVKLISMFKSLASINYLDNKNVVFDKNIFKNSESLVTASFANNQINVLHKNMIKSLSRIESLDLSHNHIAIIPVNFFSGSQTIKSLKMSFNKFKTIKV